MSTAAKNSLPLRILVLDDELEIRQTLAMCLELVGHAVVTCTRVREALQELSKSSFDLVFLDAQLGDENGMDFLPNILSLGGNAKVVIITAIASVTTAVEAMKAGAADYLPKPFTPAQVNLLTKKIAEQKVHDQRLRLLQEKLGEASPEADLTTSSIEMTQALTLARQAATTAMPVLITGESGIGKSLLARFIHLWSVKPDRPFVVAQLRGEPASRAETELFGRPNERGGHVQTAEGGTLVIDDLTDLSLPLQAKVLQWMQSTPTADPDGAALPRVITIASGDPRYAVTSGKLSVELFNRLAGFRINIPPLRSRPDDVVMLAERYLGYFCKQYRRTISSFAPEALDALMQYAWPGNVRELRAVIERACISCRTNRITANDLPADQFSKNRRVTIGDAVPLETIEEMHIRRVLESTESFDEAATILKIDPATLWRKRKRYGC